MHPLLAPALLLATAMGAALPEQPGSEFAGLWRITHGESADIDDIPAAVPAAALLGATVEFETAAVNGPAPLGCTDASFTEQPLPPEMLFQGTLGADAATRARALHLSQEAAPSLLVQCSTGLFDYHMTQQTDASGPRLLIMLDRVIYTLERAAPTPSNSDD